MKNKLLKSTLLLSLAIPTVSALSSCNISIKHDQGKSDTETKTFVTFVANGATLTGTTVVSAKVGRQFCTIPHPIATKNGYVFSYWVYAETASGKKAGEKVKDSDPIFENMKVSPYFEADVELKNCLTVVALQHSMVYFANHGYSSSDTKPDLKYSLDGYQWTQVDYDKPAIALVSVEPGKTLYIKGNNPNGFNTSDSKYTSISIAGSVNLAGNIMTLLDNGKGTTTKVPCEYCFARLFEGASGIKVISSNFLPATTLTTHCYDSMFKNCTNLNDFPTYLLPATVLAKSCYSEMFSGCESLDGINVKLLTKATSLAETCYFRMFKGCKGIKTLDSAVLPSAGLAKGCYTAMFEDSGLTSIPAGLLSQEDLVTDCYYGMFANCSGLTDVSAFTLPATTLSDYCYEYMFYNCINLTKAPALPATTLAVGCYYSMFYNCSSLTTAPTLYNSTSTAELAESCYENMFYNCTSLTDMPTLGFTSLVEKCYASMFKGCTALTNVSSLPATTLAASCYANMFEGCTSLITPPTISKSGYGVTTTLAAYCCDSMFSDCTSLKSTPALYATTGKNYCYRSMFSGCSALREISSISLSSNDYTSSTAHMFDGCHSIQFSKSGSSSFWNCKNADSDYTQSMFQDTYGQIEKNPSISAGTWYYSNPSLTAKVSYDTTLPKSYGITIDGTSTTSIDSSSSSTSYDINIYASAVTSDITGKFVLKNGNTIIGASNVATIFATTEVTQIAQITNIDWSKVTNDSTYTVTFVQESRSITLNQLSTGVFESDDSLEHIKKGTATTFSGTVSTAFTLNENDKVSMVFNSWSDKCQPTSSDITLTLEDSSGTTLTTLTLKWTDKSLYVGTYSPTTALTIPVGSTFTISFTTTSAITRTWNTELTFKAYI